MTISGHFFANYINIFHKTEFQTVILRCLMGLNLIWYKSYDTKCKMQKTHTSANSPKFESDKWPFYDRFWPFFCNYMNIFQKTEIQTVILRCLTGLSFIWYKSYDTKSKIQTMHNFTVTRLTFNLFFLMPEIASLQD